MQQNMSSYVKEQESNETIGGRQLEFSTDSEIISHDNLDRELFFTDVLHSTPCDYYDDRDSEFSIASHDYNSEMNPSSIEDRYEFLSQDNSDDYFDDDS